MFSIKNESQKITIILMYPNKRLNHREITQQKLISVVKKKPEY